MIKSENVVEYASVGEVRYVRNTRARNISIRINRQGEVRVTVPGYVNMKKAEDFFLSKKSWVISKIEALGPVLENTVKEGDMLNVKGKSVPVQLKNGHESVEEAVWRILHREARVYLPGRVRMLAEKHGFKVSGVKIRRMKSRWGSCNIKNTINLNSWLMMLPDHLTDYVILHEMVHTRHKNHSNRFWETLDTVTGGCSKALRRELRKQQIMSVHTEKDLGC